MSRLFTCGFEENNLTATMWTSTGGTASVQTAVANSGTYALRVNPSSSSGNIRKNLFANKTSGTLYTRFYYRLEDIPAANTSMFNWLNASASTVVRLTILSTGVLRLTNEVTTTTADSSITLLADTWYRIEVRYLISDTVGEIELFVDGNSEASITGEDTLNTNARTFFFGVGGGSSIDSFYDDIAVNDEAGGVFDGLPGAGNIAFQKAASDDSITWERTPTDTTNWDRVDDLPGAPDDATTYNSEAVTLNSVDRLNAGTLPAEVTSDAQITLVDVYGRVGSDQTSAAKLRFKLWDEGGSLTDGPNIATGLNGWRRIDTDEHLVFDASGKTKANVESFDYGYENITEVATRERRITALWANVEWIEAAAPGPSTEMLPDQFGSPQPTIIRREVTPY